VLDPSWRMRMQRVCFVAVLWVFVHAVEPQTSSQCDKQVKDVTTVCMANVEKAKAAMNTPCKAGSAAHLAKLKSLIQKQQQSLSASDSALVKARRKAGDIATKSAQVRTQLLAGLAKQKAGKQNVVDAKKRAAAEDQGLVTLHKQADAAMQDAVKLAGATGDEGQVSAAKQKAHSLYRKMVDEKIRIASVHRQVVEAQTSLAKVSSEVEKMIHDAKGTANAEAEALRKVARARTQMSKYNLQKSKYAAAEASEIHSADASRLKATSDSLKSADIDISKSKKVVTNANKVESQARKAEAVVSQTRVNVGPLDLGMLRDEAKKIVASGGWKEDRHGHKQHPKSVHNEFANQVSVIEKKRLAAKEEYKRAASKLRSLQSSRASALKIESAKDEVDIASLRLTKAVNEQKVTVMKVVNAVEDGIP